MAIAAGDLAAAGVGAAVGQSAGNSSVRLAVAILLFWLAGLMFFVAFGQGARYVEDWSGAGGGLGALRSAFSKIFQQGAKNVQGATGNMAPGGTGG